MAERRHVSRVRPRSTEQRVRQASERRLRLAPNYDPGFEPTSRVTVKALTFAPVGDNPWATAKLIAGLRERTLEHLASQPPVGILNVRSALSFARGIEFRFFGKNLFDERRFLTIVLGAGPDLVTRL